MSQIYVSGPWSFASGVQQDTVLGSDCVYLKGELTH